MQSGEPKPDEWEKRVLRYVAQSAGNGGYTSGHISRETGLGSDRRMMAITRATVLVPMMHKGWLAPLDDGKPVIFCVTPAGRAALAASGSEGGGRG